MPLIFKNKFLKIGIVFLAINLLACIVSQTLNIYRLAEKGDTGAQAKLGELYVREQLFLKIIKRPLNGIAKLLIKEMRKRRIIWEQCMLWARGRSKL